MVNADRLPSSAQAAADMNSLADSLNSTWDVCLFAAPVTSIAFSQVGVWGSLRGLRAPSRAGKAARGCVAAALERRCGSLDGHCPTTPRPASTPQDGAYCAVSSVKEGRIAFLRVMSIGHQLSMRMLGVYPQVTLCGRVRLPSLPAPSVARM
jgi:hypothetical protein